MGQLHLLIGTMIGTTTLAMVTQPTAQGTQPLTMVHPTDLTEIVIRLIMTETAIALTETETMKMTVDSLTKPLTR